jgi:uncharacterized protein YajQ (UPF0234 family)
MPAQQSFDVTTGCDLQEVDNAINQAQRELSQRYDFKGVDFTLSFTRATSLVLVAAPDDYKLQAILELMQAKMIRRGVPVKNLDKGKVEPAHGSSVRQEIKLKQTLDADCSKKIVKFIKEQKYKKVQAAILGEQVRISSPSRDELQAAMQALRGEDFGVELQYGNYR